MQALGGSVESPLSNHWGKGVRIKMAEQECPELTSSHGHMGITPAHRVAVSENDLRTSRKEVPQMKT